MFIAYKISSLGVDLMAGWQGMMRGVTEDSGESVNETMWWNAAPAQA